MIKIGNLDIDKFYLGDKSDVKIYLGNVKVWPEEAPETYPYAFKRVSRGGSAYTVNCNSTSSNTISSGDTHSGLGYSDSYSPTSDNTPVSVVFGDCCQSIGDYACSGWTYLSSITISDNVTSLGAQSFYDTHKLEHLKIGSGITQIPTRTFYTTGESGSTKPDLDLSANVGLNVGKNAFSYCYFNNMIFPNNCILSSGAFQYCSASTLTFGSGTIISEDGAYSSSFSNSTILNIDLNGVTKIRDYAFAETSGYTSITIPSSVTTFGRYAFNSVSTLNSVTIDYASNATLGYNQFRDSSITSLTIGSNPTTIGQEMFTNCTKLTTLVIPSNISSIETSAFEGCSGLTSLVIQSNILSINDESFNGCSGLTSITVHSATPPTLGYDVFYNTNNCPIYVPPESVDAYKAASGWSKYASRIQAIPT